MNSSKGFFSIGSSFSGLVSGIFRELDSFGIFLETSASEVELHGKAVIINDWMKDQGVKEGDRVIAMTGTSGMAEKVAVFAASIFKLPDSMSFSEGAAFPLNY